jgi:hypothetical protein
MSRQYEYEEGQKALENFKELATAILQTAPKKTKKKQPKKAAKKTSRKSDSDA